MQKTIYHDLLQLTLNKIFGNLSIEAFESVFSLLEWKELSGGEILFHAGDQSDSLYGVLSGRLQAYVTDGSGEKVILGEIPPGETVGEMGVFTDSPRSADIIAIRDSVLVKISRETFEKIIAISPRVVLNITNLIIERLNRQNLSKKTNYKITNIALICLHNSEVEKQFCQKIFQSLRKQDTCQYLSIPVISKYFNNTQIANAEKSDVEKYRLLSNWLDEQEAQYSYVLYETDSMNSEWTKRCIRQADKVLIISESHFAPNPQPSETSLLYGRYSDVSKTLILIHPSKTDIPSKTSIWLQNRQVQRHFHVEQDKPSDVERIRRYLMGQSVGLVLSGGGARGFVHVGVFRALEEYGIPVDFVGGTSMGSIIASFIAMGNSAEKLYGVMRAIYLEGKNPTSDFNLIPYFSLIKGKKVEEILEKYYGTVDIEDLWRSFYCVSSNITKAVAVIHQHGKLRKYVRASISLPGVFPPVIDDDGLLVDGGIFNNTPVDVMLSMGVGKVISVDMNIQRSLQKKEEIQTGNTWTSFKARVMGNSTGAKIPNMMSMIFQSTTIASDFKANQYKPYCDLYINPNVSNFGLMDWKSYDKIVEIGYQTAVSAIKEQLTNTIDSFK
ncbi:patatin-like phospholipase family protein [Emticicia agri]|uniref:Cyclic nucleotide-binding domain-containing protein n=1 Tax=Emticicia agri TaxID=2492393 RepID=A0A4Q5LYQ4_9BACT|nr:patatin-like phospholipase family protein [Emticicia agri]RYU94663.1 cyclic nucleotide-binding domain-containing protein [Emticicia agri]